ncbi:hypothetical protein H5410_019430 [Solanum commersonii]|uniref:Secreted protein n=1 Tax=Solanum commersonii TaxID=4109 RepID=A0A9J5Z7D7_SOLCO|nr:hypothetical protein H5410_019430 [Solanum commersonii]
MQTFQVLSILAFLHSGFSAHVLVFTYPVPSRTILEIFIFLLEPLYNSSKLHGNLFSTGAAFRIRTVPPVLLLYPSDPPKNSAKISSASRELNLNPLLSLGEDGSN